MTQKSQRVKSDNEELLDLAITISADMLKNGGETYRAEECANKILLSGNAVDTQVFAIPTSILITAVFENEVFTRSASVKERDVNLKNIDILNDISRRVSEKTVTPIQAREKITEMYENRPKFYLLALFATLSAASFTVIYGTSVFDFIYGAVAAFITNFILKIFKKRIGYNFITALFGSIITAAAARIIGHFTECNTAAVIIGGIMPMLPGLSMTNAVRDTINGDVVSGSSKAIEAILQAVGIAAGVGMVLAFKTGGGA